MKKTLIQSGIIVMVIALTSAVLWAGSPPLGLPPVPIPADNPQSDVKVQLGKKLYNDKRFSADGTVSCATCHKEDKAFTDGLRVSKGFKGQEGTRNAPTVINAAYYTSQFWDGRVPSLEEQAKGPFINPVEHGLKNFDPILKIVREDKAYTALFKKAFGTGADEITIEHVAKAIAAFERTVISGNSPFDRYLYGNDKTAMSPAAIRGLEVFRLKGRCVDCHTIGQTSAVFTDNKFHNIGVGFSRIQDNLMDIVDAMQNQKESGEKLDTDILTSDKVSELGRFAVTLDPSDIGRFKTPSLRNVAVTGPYMHDGSIDSLEEVVELYDQGGEENPMLDGGIRPLRLTEQEKSDLVEFMKALTSPEYAKASR